MRSNSEIVDLIISLYTEKGYSLSKLSAITKIPKSSLSRYFNKNRQFPINKTNVFAHALNVSEEYILGVSSNDEKNNKVNHDTQNCQQLVDTYNQLEQKRQNNVLNYATSQLNEQKQEKNREKIIDLHEETAEYDVDYETVELYGYISAGVGLDLYDEVTETIKYYEHIPKHDIALRVSGDSMEPMFRDEEIVFIKKVSNIYHGQIGAFIVNGAGFLKKYYLDSDGVRLVSLNKDYQDIVLNEHDTVKLVGTVVL